MTCEVQPSAGDGAQASVSYPDGTYSVDLTVHGQTAGTSRVLPLFENNNVIYDEETGIRAPQARAVAIPFVEVVEGTGSGFVIPSDHTEGLGTPEAVHWEVENTSETTSMLGFGMVTVTLNYTVEASNFEVPWIRIDGSNVSDHDLLFMPLTAVAENGAVTTAGLSVAVSIGPGTVIVPGQKWSDQINVSVLSQVPDDVEIHDWKIRVEGMIL